MTIPRTAPDRKPWPGSPDGPRPRTEGPGGDPHHAGAAVAAARDATKGRGAAGGGGGQRPGPPGERKSAAERTCSDTLLVGGYATHLGNRGIPIRPKATHSSKFQAPEWHTEEDLTSRLQTSRSPCLRDLLHHPRGKNFIGAWEIFITFCHDHRIHLEPRFNGKTVGIITVSITTIMKS